MKLFIKELICFFISMQFLNINAQIAKTSKYLSLVVPTIYKGAFISYDATHQAVTTNDINTLPHDNSMIKLFPNSQSSITIFSEDNNGNLSILGNTLAVDKGSYKVLYEFSEFQPRPSTKDSNGNFNTYCVGISVRLIATINTTKGNIDLSKIFSMVGASGGTNKLSGQLEISIKGINSQTLTSLNPIPNSATLTTDNIITALQAIAAIKSHFSDTDVIITPEILGFYQSNTSGNADNQSYQRAVQMIQQMN